MDIKDTSLHKFFNLFWLLIKRHIETNPFKGSSQEVEILIDDIEATRRAFKDDEPLYKFATACLIAFYTYLEETKK